MNTPARLQTGPDWVAVDKPAGLASIPEGDLSVPCALRLAEADLGRRLWIVHRLDKEVSGVLLFASSAAGHRRLCLAFQERAVRKFYHALVHGVIDADEGVIDAPLRVFGSGRTGVALTAGKPSRTDYRVLRRHPGATAVDIELHTGRKHQIRAHFFHLGHPIIGDRRYGDRTAAQAWPRLFLHARELTFPSPDGTTVTLTSPIPPSFAETEEQVARSSK